MSRCGTVTSCRTSAGVELRQLRPAVLDRYLAELQRGGLSPASVKKIAGMLQGVLQRAVEWERIAQNPMRVAHKPKARRRIVIRPIAPAQVEQLRRHLLADGRLRCATLVSVLAYSGYDPVRPSRWPGTASASAPSP